MAYVHLSIVYRDSKCIVRAPACVENYVMLILCQVVVFLLYSSQRQSVSMTTTGQVLF